MSEHKDTNRDHKSSEAKKSKEKLPPWKHEGNRVLVKSDPGMGKTTWAKKIAHDWAVGLFRLFATIFFVSLMLVRPGDAIENIIIQQTPPLEGLGIKNQQLQNSWTLLVTDVSLSLMDGMRYPEEQRLNFSKIIKGQNCIVVLFLSHLNLM